MALLLVTTVLSAVVVQHMAAAIEQERGYDFCSGIHYKYSECTLLIVPMQQHATPCSFC